MQFCPKCNNSYSISRFDESMKITMDTPSSLSNDDSSNDDNNIQNQETKKLTEEIQDKRAHFKCTNCGNIEPIKQGEIILSRLPIGKNADYFNPQKIKLMIHDKSLPHTRNYLCPNKNCKSYSDHSLRDAIFFKPSKNNYVTKYVCTACETSWM